MPARHRMLALLLALSAIASCCAVAEPPGGAPPPAEDTICDDITSLPADVDRCVFAQKHCDSEGFINWLPLYYCHVRPHGGLATTLLLSCAVVLLVLLFHVMGRTADDFLATILSQISQDMGLPPRLGGVTLLALGNGAPDLSSSIAAVRSGNYPLALGSLTGGAMFVGCVVAGRIVTLNKGVSARGAQIRDVASLLIAVTTVTAIVASGQVTYGSIILLLSLYGGYVLVVAVADFSKRAGVKWRKVGRSFAARLPWDLHRRELGTPLLGGGRLLPQEHWPPHDDGVDPGDERGSYPGEVEEGLQMQVHPTVTQLPRTASAGAFAAAAGSLQQRSSGPGSEVEMASPLPGSPARAGSTAAGSEVFKAQPAASGSQDAAGSGANSAAGSVASQPQARMHPPPIVPSSAGLSYEELARMSAGEYRRRALADMAASKSFYKRKGTGMEQLEKSDADEEEEESADGGTYLPPTLARDLSTEREEAALAAAEGGKAGLPPREAARLSRDHPPTLPSPHPQRSQQEAADEEEEEEEEDPGPIGRLLETLCWPVMVVLRSTVPIVEAKAYVRSAFLTAMALAPFFVQFYLGNWSWSGLMTAALTGGGLLCVCSVLTGNSHGEAPFWGLGTSFPIGAALVAVAGFVVAAMWIDIFASEIVGMLHFLGLLAGVAPAVLGVTVLAWGNSITDYMANTAMAVKSAGGTSMAMTACFAGPLFNMLMGLGVGFWALLADSHRSHIPVKFDAVVIVGCVFALLNCGGIVLVALLNRQKLSERYGWTMVAWYGAYLAVVTAVVASGG